MLMVPLVQNAKGEVGALADWFPSSGVSSPAEFFFRACVGWFVSLLLWFKRSD